jgi:hypothetical protein
MRKEREEALKLRLEGKSYTEISISLNVPKSTLSSWLSEVTLSPAILEKINSRTQAKSREAIIRRNKRQTELAKKRALEGRKSGTAEVGKISNRELLLIGAALYWAEGYKRPKVVRGREVTQHPISLTNADPDLIRAFLKFLRGHLRVPDQKIKASLRIFGHQNEHELLKFWQEATKLPLQNFKKTYVGVSKSSQGKRPFNRLPYGVIQISVADTPLFHKLIGHIEGLKRIM